MKWEITSTGGWAIRTLFDVNAIVRPDGSWAVYKARDVAENLAEGAHRSVKRAKHNCLTALLTTLRAKQDAIGALCAELTELL